jgi:hypothetical protein
MIPSLATAFGVLTYNDSLSFGKYKGRPLNWLVAHDPSYILWCSINTKTVFSKEVIDFAVQNISKVIVTRFPTRGSTAFEYMVGELDDELDDEHEADMFDIFHDSDMGDR